MFLFCLFFVLKKQYIISCTYYIDFCKMKNAYRYTQSFLEFGATVDTKSFLFCIIIKDLNDQIIKIPFRDNSYQEITVKRLINLYLAQTSCKKLFTSTPIFRALQGQFQGQIIPQQFKLLNLGINISKPCFKVQDKSQADEESFLYVTTKMKNKEKIQQISLKIQYNENTYEQKILANEKISKVKATLLKKKQFFKVTIDMIQLRYGQVILDSQKYLKDYNIFDNHSSVIHATIIKKQGCFRGHMKVQIYNDKTEEEMFIEIRDIKVGDKIISYNQQKLSFQRDEVLAIHQSLVDQYVQIVLQDKSVIQTTSNHLFLCNDNQYRKLHYSQNHTKLDQGMLLKTSKGQLKIQMIIPKRLQQKQQFYHLLIKNNHNYLLNHIIVHNMFIKIDYQKHLQQVNVSQKQPIGNIKNILQDLYKKHNSNCIKLVYNGTQLKNGNTLSDHNIKKESKLNLVIKTSDQFHYFHGQTQIKLKNASKAIKSLAEEDEICLSLGQNQFAYHNFKPIQLKTKIVTDYYIITLGSQQNKTILKVYIDTYLQLENGQSKTVAEIHQLYQKQNKISLKTLNGPLKIQKMMINKQKCSLYKLHFQSLQKYGFIIEQKIIIHNDIVHFHYQNQKQHKNIHLSINSQSKVDDLKQKICQLSDINLQNGINIQFYCHQKLIQNNLTFQQLDIKFQDIIVVTASQKVQSKIFVEDFIEEQEIKTVYLKTENNQEYSIQYEANKGKNVKEIMKFLIPNYKSSFFFMFGGFMLQPKDHLNRLQDTTYFNQPHNIVLVVKNQRLSFIMNMNIQGSQIQNQSMLKYSANKISLLDLQNKKEINDTNQYKAAKKRIANNQGIYNNFFKEEEFYKPFLYFTSQIYKEDIDNFIRNFEIHLKENIRNEHQKFIFKLIKNLYTNFGYLSHCIQKPLKETYFGMRNFRISQYFQKNQTFYWYSFLKTTQNQSLVRDELDGQSGTLFHIISTTGKKINDYSIHSQKDIQLLFLPYTYFIINKILKTDSVDEVWLTEIASPTSFQKNIILWVDDIPYNNLDQIHDIQTNSDVQIIQLISTLSAEKWLKQFGWLLTWKEIGFKLITDNFREEFIEKEQGIVKVGNAGFELLQKIYLKHGMTTKCCIYTGNKAKAQSILQESYLSIKGKYKSNFWIGDQRKQITNFCKEL